MILHVAMSKDEEERRLRRIDIAVENALGYKLADLPPSTQAVVERLKDCLRRPRAK